MAVPHDAACRQTVAADAIDRRINDLAMGTVEFGSTAPVAFFVFLSRRETERRPIDDMRDDNLALTRFRPVNSELEGAPAALTAVDTHQQDLAHVPEPGLRGAHRARSKPAPSHDGAVM